MRTEAERKEQAEALLAMKPKVLARSVFGDDHHAAIDAQVAVLREDLENNAIYDRYERGAENVLQSAIEARQWIDEESESDTLTEEWKSLVRE